jgi:hypothetical protein
LAGQLSASPTSVSTTAKSRPPNATRPLAPGPRGNPAKTVQASAATEKIVSNAKCRAIKAANSASAMRSTIGRLGLRTRAERDFQVQRVAVGQRDEAVRRAEITAVTRNLRIGRSRPVAADRHAPALPGP